MFLVDIPKLPLNLSASIFELYNGCAYELSVILYLYLYGDRLLSTYWGIIGDFVKIPCAFMLSRSNVRRFIIVDDVPKLPVGIFILRSFFFEVFLIDLQNLLVIF